MAWDRISDRVPVLRGEGLTLRELSEEDLPAWFARLSDPEAAALAGDPVATSLQAVIDGRSIGLTEFDPRERSAVVGAAVGRAHWNHAFGPLGLAQIEAVVLARNARVIRGLEKLGFERQPGVPAGRGIGGADGESVLFVLRR